MKNTIPELSTKEFADLAEHYFGGKPKKKEIEKQQQGYSEEEVIEIIKKIDAFNLEVNAGNLEKYYLMEIELNNTKRLLESCERALGRSYEQKVQ